MFVNKTKLIIFIQTFQIACNNRFFLVNKFFIDVLKRLWILINCFSFIYFQDSIGQNSNDSSSGVGTGVGTAPGTPNSLAMRPTPSPTGSSGSRSMSPAVGMYYPHFILFSVRNFILYICLLLHSYWGIHCDCIILYFDSERL